MTIFDEGFESTSGPASVPLRDGRSVLVRQVTSADREAVARFLADLPPGDGPAACAGAVSADLLAALEGTLQATAPAHDGLAAWTRVDGVSRIVALGAFCGCGERRADATLLVSPEWRNLGLASALLRRLGHAAATRGFLRLRLDAPRTQIRRLTALADSGLPIRLVEDQDVCHAEMDLTTTDTSVSIAAAREQASVAASLRPLLSPEAVAVIGASRHPERLGRRILTAITRAGFTGRILPINPGTHELDGLPCYRSITAAPGPVDLAVIAVPAAVVPSVLAECGRAGVRAACVISAGFAETGDAGRAVQDALRDAAQADGLRLLGPNCMGVLNARGTVRLNASLAPSLPACGGVALTSQSGGVALTVLDLATHRGLGFSTVVSLGNECDVASHDLLLCGAADADTTVHLLYLESVRDPRRFARVARRVSRDKPIVALKSGRTPEGTRAATSHTAGLLTRDDLVTALFRQSGVIRVDTIDEMLDTALLLDTQPLPASDRVLVITNTGGAGILAADACVARGLALPELPAAARAAVAPCLPAHLECRNPIDLGATADGPAYYRAVHAALSCRAADAVVVAYTEIDHNRTFDVLASIERAVGLARGEGHDAIAVAACVLAAAREPLPLRGWHETIPVYASPEHAVRALAHAVAHARWRATPLGSYTTVAPARLHAVRDVCRAAAAARGSTWLTFTEIEALAEALGWPWLGRVARTSSDACALARACGYPVAAKAVLPGQWHKTKAGTVFLNLPDDTALVHAFDALAAGLARAGSATGDGVLVQPMVSGAVEMFAGLQQDTRFGPLVAFGRGGTAVESHRQVTWALCLLTDAETAALVRDGQGSSPHEQDASLAGHDVRALETFLESLAQLGAAVPEILELDANPVMVLPQASGIRLVDLRVRVGAVPA